MNKGQETKRVQAKIKEETGMRKANRKDMKGRRSRCNKRKSERRKLEQR